MLQPGQGVSLVVPKKGSTWAAYWSGWQYLYTAPPGTRPLEQISGEPRQRGIGVFARFGFADKDTNPTEWAVSGGIGGRGLIPSRDNDCFGVGYYSNSIQTLRLSGLLGIKDSTQGLECFYNIANTPAAHLTLDLQVVNSPQKRLETATVLGLRATLDFEGAEHETGSMLLEIRPAFPVKIQRMIKTHRNFVRRSTTKYHTFASAHFHRFPP